jgi:hypothetical protein
LAEKKNFIIENYNGTDYDTLYPETISGQVLLDDQAQRILNLPSGDTLNNAFNHIAYGGGSYVIGDVLVTARNNLGDNWLLCNGAIVDGSQYPVLKNLLKSAPHVGTFKSIGASADTLYRPGKAGEILWKDTFQDSPINSYDFYTSLSSQSSNVDTLTFFYVPSQKKYMYTTIKQQSSQGHDTNGYYTYDLNSMPVSTTFERMTVSGGWEVDGDLFYVVQTFENVQPCLVTSFPNTFNVREAGATIPNSLYTQYNNIVKLGGKYIMYAGYVNGGVINPRCYIFNKFGTSLLGSAVVTSGTKNTFFACDGTVALLNYASSKFTAASPYIILENSTEATPITLPTSDRVFGSSHGFFYLNGTKLYQSVDHANTWNVLINDLDVGTLYDMLENPQDHKVYIIGSAATKILSFDSANVLLPTYSPATGLHAYIKAKN